MFRVQNQNPALKIQKMKRARTRYFVAFRDCYLEVATHRTIKKFVFLKKIQHENMTDWTAGSYAGLLDYVSS
jgi:hypothetical protein